MGIFQAQAGGIPLVNTYQFKEGPGLPDISGFRQHGQGRARAAGPTRQGDPKAKELEGLQGEVATYRMQAAALDIEVESTLANWQKRFENDYNGVWDDFWDAENKNMSNTLLDFQTKHALHEGYRQTMASNRKRHDQVIADPDIAPNVALHPVTGGFHVFGQRRDGSGFGWGATNEVYRPMSGLETASYLDTHSVVGEQVIFPAAYDMNKHYDDLVSHFRSVQSPTSGTSTSSSGPIDPNNPYSHLFTRKGGSKDNLGNIMGVIYNSYNMISPEGRMSLYADAQRNLKYQQIQTADGKYDDIGIPDYQLLPYSAGNKNYFTITVGKDANGNDKFWDINNPEEHEQALQSHARFVAATHGQAYFNYEINDETTLSFGREQEPVTTGIHTLAANGSAPHTPSVRLVGTGMANIPITHDLQRVQVALQNSNPALSEKFGKIKNDFINLYPEYGVMMNDKNTTVEEKNLIGQLLANHITESGMFNDRELDLMFRGVAGPQFVQPMGWGDRVLNRAVGLVSLGNFQLDTGKTVQVTDNTRTGIEAFAAMAMGIPVTYYRDERKNIDQYNDIQGFLAEGPMRILGVGGGVIDHSDINQNGVVFVAGDHISSNQPWATPDWIRANPGQAAYDNHGQIPVYGGRTGDFIIPENTLKETKFEYITQEKGQSVVDYEKRKKFRELKEHDKAHTYVLESPEFNALFKTPQEASQVVQRIRSTYGLNDESKNIKVVFVPGEVAITDPGTLDLRMTERYGVQDYIDNVHGTLNFEQMQNAGKVNILPEFLRVSAPQPSRQQQQQLPQQESNVTVPSFLEKQ